MSSLRASMQRLNTAALDLAPRARRFLYLWTYLSGFLAVQILHLALDELVLNIWLSLALTAGFVYAYNLAPRWRSVTTYGVSIVAVGLSVFFFLKLQQNIWLAGGTLGILLGLLMVLLSFKAFAPGDHRFIILVCVIFIIYSAHQSYDLKLMLMLPVFLFCAGCSLYAASQIEVATRVSQTVGSDVTDAVSETRIEVGRQFLAMLLRAVVGLIAVSAVAFVVTPHSEEGARQPLINTAPPVDPVDKDQGGGSERDRRNSRGELQREAEVGLGNDFDLSSGSKLTADPRPVLQMKSHRSGYLRAQVYDVYTGSGWVKSPQMLDADTNTILARHGGKADDKYREALPEGLEAIPSIVQTSNEPETAFKIPLLDFPSKKLSEQLSAKGVVVSKNPVWSANQAAQPRYAEIHQEIKLLEAQPSFYFAMYAPYRLENISLMKNGNLGDMPLLDAASCLRAREFDKQDHDKGFSYTVRSLELVFKDSELREVISPGPPAIVEPNTQVPLTARPDPAELQALGIKPEQYHAVSDRVVKLSQTIANRRAFAGGQPSIYDKVQNILEYLVSDEFEYTRNYVELRPDQEFTEQFLLGSQQGHCRYFASAMAVMCRINNIPARIVSGYAPGTFSLVDNAYVYRASNAHAWVEVYFDGYGWVTYDPSPAGSEGQGGGSPLMRNLRSVIDFLTNLFVLDPAATQRLIMDALRQLWALMLRHGPQSLILLAVVGLILFAYVRLRRDLGQRRLPPLRPENAVIEAYLQALRQLERLGLARGDVGMTARRAFNNAVQSWQPLSPPLQRLLPIYERAAYAGGEPSQDDIQQAKDAVAELSALVRQRQEEMKQKKKPGG
ncbi:transglutaminase domain-containing protein [bacterium]|nr:transglutaminase domain-containing protein [bacterium]